MPRCGARERDTIRASMEFTGRLGAIALPELLQWPHNERRSGSLVVRTARREKRVLFERGMVVGCQSGNPAEYFGQHLLLHGYLERAPIMEALALCRATGARLGTALVDLGLLAPQALDEALAAHVAERVCDLFTWQHGVFYFLQELPEGVELLAKPLDPVLLALEGSRWADEHRRLRELLVHDGIVLRRSPAPPPAGLSPLAARIHAALERPQRLDDLYALVQGSKFRFLEGCHGLLVDGTVEVDRMEDFGESGSEIRMFDLMLEQAASEEVLFTARHLSLPLEWLDRFFPLWVEGEGAAAELPEDERELYARMDGNRSLRELVLDGEASREERMDLVLLQLQKGQLALLPRPMRELRALGRGFRNPWLRRFLG
jgi:hypothetical protein